jgi:uncharacterized YccA/Bax inhibitor family protein
MEISRSSNPTLNSKTFESIIGTHSEKMTIQGTVNKTFIMLIFILLAASYTWNIYITTKAPPIGWMIGGAIGGFILALITVFKQQWSPITAPIYAALQGLFLGALSAIFEQMYSGIVIQAVSLTFATLFSLLFAYKSGLIKVTENFKLGVVAATGGIALFYFATFILGLFGVNTSYFHGASLFSIGLSVVIVIVAALNLVLDFDFIEQGAERGAPKYMEWYGAFGLTVTLIWLYIEFLRLLSKLSSRR